MREKKTILLHLYDWLQTHRSWLWAGCLTVVLLLVGMALSLRYHEDIMDFLPVDEADREALELYQSRQSASRLVLIIDGTDSLREEALYLCEEQIAGLETSVDMSEFFAQMYAQLPYLMDDTVYDQLDSLCSPQAVRAALKRDKTILNTPGTGFLAPAIQSDPLDWAQLFQSSGARGFRSSNNRTYAFYNSPYGATETKHNAALVDSLNWQIGAIQSQLDPSSSGLDMRLLGAPVIAVENARRIKTDTMLCIALSLVLLITLLLYAFPRKRDIGLILLAVSFGWLVGMAVLRLVTPAVSAIVLGIGSVLIGIAVNYPLHLLVHQRYTTSVRQTLDEVLSPLVVGNITTVGAFLSLIPLQSTALRYLGIFAAAMLVGTILFCIFIMPHMMSADPTPVREIKISSLDRPHTKSIGRWTVVGLTVLFGAYLLMNSQSSNTQLFDSNLSHINYMTAQQRADIASFDSVANPLRAAAEHPERAAQWCNYWQSHSTDSLIACIQDEAEQAGFRPEAFTPFYDTLTDWQPAPVFDFGKLTKGLSDNFDYIGLCCSLIVFLFLWLSFKRFGLALIAFVPMALSWVWILAIMHLCGLQFNIVNIILATFIFGQGDDYTIFIVEGLVYEHRTGKTILPQYRQSILLSALIMLVGIGVLVFAQHPAMHSLGVITLIGMAIVLLMAVSVPPLLFRWYVKWFPV